MIDIEFSKERAQHFLDCLENGKAIEGKLTGMDLYALAAACRTVAYDEELDRVYDAETSRTAEEKMDSDWCDSVNETLTADMALAQEVIDRLTLLVSTGSFDTDGFAPQVRAKVELRDGQLLIEPGEGMPAEWPATLGQRE